MSFTSFLGDRNRTAPPPAVNDPSKVFQSTTFITPASSSSSSSTPSSSASFPSETSNTAESLFDTSLYDPAKLHPLAGLGSGQGLDYLLLEEDQRSLVEGAESALPHRGKNDEILYGVGAGYLSGLAAGGAWGFQEGFWRRLPASSARLRLNAVLNSMTRRGVFLANTAGVLALLYNCTNSGIDSYRNKHDIWGAMSAGFVSGAIYKSTAGVRPALAGATMMTLGAGGWTYAKKALF